MRQFAYSTIFSVRREIHPETHTHGGAIAAPEDVKQGAGALSSEALVPGPGPSLRVESGILEPPRPLHTALCTSESVISPRTGCLI